MSYCIISFCTRRDIHVTLHFLALPLLDGKWTFTSDLSYHPVFFSRHESCFSVSFYMLLLLQVVLCKLRQKMVKMLNTMYVFLNLCLLTDSAAKINPAHSNTVNIFQLFTFELSSVNITQSTNFENTQIINDYILELP